MFRALIERYKKYKNYKETYSKLQNLSDRELKDIGISRGMIKRIALERADYLEANSNLRGWV